MGRDLDAVLERAVAAGDPPAAQCCVRLAGVTVYEGAFGCTVDSVFDLASITKVAATTTTLAHFVAEGRCGLDDPIGRFLPDAAFGEATLRSLLAHRSGLIPWRPMFDGWLPTDDFHTARTHVIAEVLATGRTETKRAYSDLGFIALGLALEEIAGSALHEIVHPILGSRPLGYVDLRSEEPAWLAARHVLATGRTRPREPAPGQESLFSVPPQAAREMPGEVDDDHAFAMGGVAGHAGLFGTAAALAGHMEAVWLDDALGLGAVRETFLTIDPGAPPRALGFDVPTGPRSSAGKLARGAHVVGHLGFTGCSIWMDLERRLVVTLLTNRTLEGRHRVDGIRALRRDVHDAVHERFVSRD